MTLSITKAVSLAERVVSPRFNTTGSEWMQIGEDLARAVLAMAPVVEAARDYAHRNYKSGMNLAAKLERAVAALDAITARDDAAKERG